MITYRKATSEDVRPALDLALRVFMEFEAPDYEPKATVNFTKDCIENEIYTGRLTSGENLMFVALDNDKIIGMAAERDNGEILLLFVDGAYHRQGIAAALMSNMICALKMQGFDRILLESSPYALPFYLQYGFRQTGDAVNNYGCIVTPMEYIPREIWDVLDENGNKTGRYHERGRPMATGDYHLAVHVWKHNGKGEWLIDKRVPRTPDDPWGGKWETTGGANFAGEDSLTAALRETKEELGIDLDTEEGTLFYRFANHVSDKHRCLIDVWVFECECTVDELHFQPKETCGAMWATADKIREMIDNNDFFSEARSYFDEMEERWGGR